MLDRDRDEYRYNAACALALCAAADQDGRQDLLVRKCIALLVEVRESGFFADAKRVDHFNKDSDFAGIARHFPLKLA